MPTAREKPRMIQQPARPFQARATTLAALHGVEEFPVVLGRLDLVEQEFGR